MIALWLELLAILLAVVALLLSDLTAEILIAGLVFVVCIGGAGLRLWWLSGNCLVRYAAGQWTLAVNGVSRDIKPFQYINLAPLLLTIHYRSSGRCSLGPLVVWHDSADSESRRRLRLLLVNQH